MADSFSKIYLQIVFAVKYREHLIDESWEDELYKYITGIVQNRNHKLLAIGGMPDHIHIFIGLKPADSISDLVREIKKSSTSFINAKKFSQYRFRWQNGYAVFSYHAKLISTVCDYIDNQKIHHRKKSFKREYNNLLTEFNAHDHRKKPFEFLTS